MPPRRHNSSNQSRTGVAATGRIERAIKSPRVTQSLWMTGVPTVHEKEDRIELAQKMPWRSGIAFLIGFPILVYHIFIFAQLSDPQVLWWCITAVVEVISLSCLAYLVRQPPILWVLRDSGLLVVPRLRHEEPFNAGAFLVLSEEKCWDHETGAYRVWVLQFAPDHPKSAGRIVFVTQKEHALRSAWQRLLDHFPPQSVEAQ